MHGHNSPIHPSHADKMKFYATDRVMVVIDPDIEKPDGGPWAGTVIRKHQSEGWYWVRFEKRFNGHCLPIRWNQMTRVTL